MRKYKVDESLGDVIAGERVALSLSQDELARAAGLTGHTISQIERGRAVPRVDTLERIAGALGVIFELGGK